MTVQSPVKKDAYRIALQMPWVRLLQEPVPSVDWFLPHRLIAEWYNWVDRSPSPMLYAENVMGIDCYRTGNQLDSYRLYDAYMYQR